MSNAALISLQSAINTNTLSASQQAALSAALDQIIPTFPTPGDGGAVTFDNEPALARDWMASLYAIAFAGGGSTPVTLVNEILPAALPSPVTVTPNPGVGNVTLGFIPPSRNGGANGSPQVLTNAPVDLVTLNIVPEITGRFRVTITGVVANSDTVSHPFVLILNGNAGAGDFAMQQLPTLQVPPSTVGFPYALTVDCDKANVPHVFTIGALGAVIANLTGVGGGFLTIPAQGCVMTVEELLS